MIGSDKYILFSSSGFIVLFILLTSTIVLKTRQHCPKKGYGSQTKTANENETYLTIGGGGKTETGGGTV